MERFYYNEEFDEVRRVSTDEGVFNSELAQVLEAARVEIATLTASLRQAEAERDRLRTMVDTMTQTNDEMFALYETERVARESAEQLAVWAVRKGVMVGHDECVRPCIWFDVHRGVEYDGTDAGILAALRRAAKGEA